MAKKKKIRVDMRKNRSKPPRDRQWTRGFEEHGFAEESTKSGERVRAKGDLSRRRTIVQEEAAGTTGDAPEMPAVDASVCVPGRVLRVHGLYSVVETEDGRLFRCAVRRLLRTLATDERSLVTTGDRVWLRPADAGVRSQESGVRSQESGDRSQEPERGDEEEASLTPDSSPLTPVLEGLIERVEPRHGVLTRASRRREHVLVANVDQVVIVMSLMEPELKPHLIDRYLASAEQGGVKPIICLNKADLVDPAAYQPLVGLYRQLGIPTLLTSAVGGRGIAPLRARLVGRQTVFSGQSGVGKSSLLNAVQPGLGLRVREVSDVNQKGKHTTTTAELIKLDFGGWVVDTPGIRQFELWDIRPEEVEGFFPEFRPFVTLCAFPDCTHTHEERCAVKRAVDRRQISASRYHSYIGMFEGEGGV
jgi:ribosome biogenesis GTPase